MSRCIALHLAKASALGGTEEHAIDRGAVAAAEFPDALVGLGIAQEITGGQRNRLFAYEDYLTILSEGADPL